MDVTTSLPATMNNDENNATGAPSVTEYYQYTEEQDSENINNSQQEEIENEDVQEEEEEETWRFTDIGHINAHQELSRDGSVHVTDEVFNAASHLAASILSLLGTALLVVESSAQVEPWKIVSFSIYGASLINLFVMSTLHHGIIGSRRVEYLLRMLDYLAIYPLIAGTFTPLCLVYYHNDPLGWIFFGTVWFVALVGMGATLTCFTKIPKWMSTTIYITLGWLGAIMSYWLITVMTISGVMWLLLGGIFYTVGGYVFTTENPNPIPGKFGFHEIWHVAVVLGALSHYILMYFYVLPYENTDE